MNNYILHTRVGWRETYQQLAETFKKWGISTWHITEPKGVRSPNSEQSEEDRTVTVTYQLRGKDIRLSMGKQKAARDNLRVLYLAVEDMRMNEKRGINEILESAYLQLAGPQQQQNPYEVLGIMPDAPIEVAEAAYKARVRVAHPDAGGSVEQMKALNEAIKQIRNHTVQP